MANNFKIIIASRDTTLYVRAHNLIVKFKKATSYLSTDLRHPSLNVELLEPKGAGVYSFRIDQKYRGLFFFNKAGAIEIIRVTNHYN